MIQDFKCSAPWEGMFINPDGDFRVCCSGQSLGNLNKNSITELVNGPLIESVRKDMLTKGHSSYCVNCMESENTSGKSLRETYKTDLSQIDTSTFRPKILDIRWWNTCQLRCVYCNSEWSSAYAVWEGKSTRVSVRNWQQEVVDFLKHGDTNFAHMYFLGGEPLLLRENIDLIDMAPKEAIFGLVTNLSVANVDTLPVYQKFLERPTGWLISLEATGNKFEYIRRNAKWETTKQNYEKLYNTEKPKGSNQGCHLTYCIFSAFTLVDTFDWLKSVHKTVDDNHSFISILLGPDPFNIMDYPANVKLLAIQEMDKLIEKHNDFLNIRTLNFIKSMRQSLLENLNSFKPGIVTRLLNFIEKNDSEMSPIKFKDEWPEFYQILNNSV